MRREQDQAYEESLKQDRQKEEEKRKKQEEEMLAKKLVEEQALHNAQLKEVYWTYHIYKYNHVSSTDKNTPERWGDRGGYRRVLGGVHPLPQERFCAPHSSRMKKCPMTWGWGFNTPDFQV
jgi:hypothetical protein